MIGRSHRELDQRRDKAIGAYQRAVEAAQAAGTEDFANGFLTAKAYLAMGRAAWGLTYGVTEEAKDLVEEGLLRALPEETNEYTRGQEFRALARVATAASRPYLTSVVESDMETDEIRKTARRILASLDAKQGR